MTNLNYNRSKAREYYILHNLEKHGYWAIRTAGSHGKADVIGIKPCTCGMASHFEVKAIQVKVSQNLKNILTTVKTEETPCGLVNIEYWKFPVRIKNANHKQKPKSVPKKMDTLKSRRRLRKRTVRG